MLARIAPIAPSGAGGATRAIDADVAVHREGESRFKAEVRIRLPGGELGERSLEEASCDVLADAVATILTMATDPAAPHPIAPAATSSAAAHGGPADAANRAPPDQDAGTLHSAGSGAARSEPRFAAGGVAVVDSGTLPSPAFGVGGALAWYPVPPVRIEAAVARWFEQSATVSGQPFGGTFQLTSADLRSCAALLGRVVTLGPCAGIELAHIDARGFRSTTVTGGDATWWSPSAGVLARWTPLPALGFAVLSDVVVPVARPTFVIVSGGSIHQAAAASVRGQIAAEVRF
ncbi:MAG TPA: hypothetical protein VGI39_14235 [Polyangiaceae bacterium]